MENNILATDHILLCGIVPNLVEFVIPLRAKHLTKYPPKIILHDKEPNDKEWNKLSEIPEIFFVKVSPYYYF